MRVEGVRSVVIRGDEGDCFSLAYLILKNDKDYDFDCENVTRDMLSIANGIIEEQIEKEKREKRTERKRPLYYLFFTLFGATSALILNLIF